MIRNNILKKYELFDIWDVGEHDNIRSNSVIESS